MVDPLELALKTAECGKVVRFYVPTRDRHGAPLLQSFLLVRVTAEMVALAGGVTTYRAKGVWRNSVGDTIAEPVYVVEAYFTGSVTAQTRRRITQVLQFIAQNGRQETVAVAVNNRLFLVSAGSICPPNHVSQKNALQEEVQLAP